MGTALCIVDGYVLDITQFIEMHPGGQHLLRYATGSDITEMFVGRQGVDGHKHVHSREALELMKTLVKVGFFCFELQRTVYKSSLVFLRFCVRLSGGTC